MRSVSDYTKQKIASILRGGDSSAGILAMLRRGAGKKPGDDPALWGILFDGMPEEMMSKNGAPSRAEWAVYAALTLFAVHQQGKDLKRDCMHKAGISFGQAAAGLAESKKDADRIIRRFNQAVTADSIEGITYHLRGMISMLRRKDIPLDYAKLAKDLYFLQTSSASVTRLEWGQDFYKELNKKA